MSELSDLVTLDRIIFSRAQSRDEVLGELVDLLAKSPAVRQPEQLRRAILDREKLCSTGIGGGIAVPHVRIESVTSMVMALGVLVTPVEFQSIDNAPVKVVFMFAGPADAHRDYLRTLARIALFCRNPKERDRLLQAQTRDEVWQVLRELR